MRLVPFISGLGLALAALPTSAELLQGQSGDPLAELNALYAGICKWEDGISIPVENVNLNDDGVADHLLTYDLPCRGQANAFSGSAGTARQIWISQDDGSYLRVLDVNARDLRIDKRPDGLFVILQQQGSYCLTADAAPCFLTLKFAENVLIWADAKDQHSSMNARLALEEDVQKETSND